MKKKSMTLLIVVLAIGFAAVSTTLIINGTIGIGTNNDNFVDGVVFDEESLSSSEGTTAEISESGRTITFTTQEMKNIDETATVNFKIKNYYQYDAVLETPAISCYFVDDHQEDAVATKKSDTNEYMTVTPGTELDGKTITAGGGISEASSVTVKQKKSYAGDGTQTVKFQCVINATAGESSTAGIEKSKKLPVGVELTNDLNNNKIADIGDEITVGTESFYVISQTDTKLNVLAKYNLNVGNVYSSNGTTLESTISSTEEGYGIQNEHIKGWIDGEKRYGTVSFSQNNGWSYDSDTTINLKEYDGIVKDALYGENGYEKYIQKTIPNSSARLITKFELEELVNNENALSVSSIKTKADDKGYSWLYSTSYWTQSACSGSSSMLWYIARNGAFGRYEYNYGDRFGVRPVVEIPLV